MGIHSGFTLKDGEFITAGVGSAVQGMTLHGTNQDAASGAPYQRLMWIPDRPTGFGFTGGARIEACIDVDVPSASDSVDVGFRLGTTHIGAQTTYAHVAAPLTTQYLLRFLIFLRNVGGGSGGTTRFWTELWIDDNATGNVMTNTLVNQGVVAENIVTITTAIEVAAGINVGTGTATGRHMIVTPYFTDFT